MLKNFVASATCSVVMIFLAALMFTSCERDFIPTSDPVEVVSFEQEVPATKASTITFTDSGVYNPNYGSLFIKNEAVKVDDRTYTFQVSTYASPTVTYEIYVKLYNHYTGNTYYEKLTQNGAGTYKVFHLTKQFITAGLFSYRYMIRIGNSTSLIRIQADNEKFDDFDTVIIPATVNNYANLRVYCGSTTDGSYEQWGFYFNQCTSWVAAKINEMWGSYDAFKNSMTSPVLSHAKNWKTRLQNAGYGVYDNAEAGDIIWWGAYGATGVGALGHVGFVHNVNSSGIQYSEYNYDGNGSYRCRRKTQIGIGKL